MKQLSTGDFDRLSTHIPDFVGAIPCDAPTPNLKRYSIIMNTDNHREDGQHWVAMQIKPKTLTFVDSFGRNPSDVSFPSDFRRAVKRLSKGRRLIYNHHLIQALNSNACGYFSIFFLDRLALNKSMRMIGKAFDNNLDDLAKNDQFVVKYYKKNFM